MTDTRAQKVLDHIDENELVKVADLVTGARLYALTALDLCNQDRA
jgi:hypothetical protein